jgi:ferredoxin
MAVVRVDRMLCVGSGLCQSMSPDLFGRPDSGYPEVGAGEVPAGELLDLARDIADCCPTGAVMLSDLAD